MRLLYLLLRVLQLTSQRFEHLVGCVHVRVLQIHLLGELHNS